MTTQADEVIEEIFRLTASDEEAAPVVPALERAYREGRWCADGIQAALTAAEREEDAG